MPDLKLNIEAAVAALGKQLDNSIESLRGTAERLIEDIKLVASVHADPMKLNVADADAACVIDFTTSNYNNMRHLELRVEGGHGGYIELASPLQPGKYRAIILLNKIGE